MNVIEFVQKKKNGEKISMVTCYDHWSAKILNTSTVDSLLVGDSLSMVVYGHKSTLSATPEMMAQHIEAVAKGAPDKFIIGDMPFPSFRLGKVEAMKTVDLLMKAGAHCIKLEGVDGHEDVIEHIIRSGVPVMGHLGLTPQSINLFGGFKVQGKNDSAAEHLVQQAMKLEALGCFSVVLECIPASLAQRITEAIEIPTIGIGAGLSVDGQVLVLQDLLGMNTDFKPKFLKTYMSGQQSIQEAVNTYDQEVKSKLYPSSKESYL